MRVDKRRQETATLDGVGRFRWVVDGGDPPVPGPEDADEHEGRRELQVPFQSRQGVHALPARDVEAVGREHDLAPGHPSRQARLVKGPQLRAVDEAAGREHARFVEDPAGHAVGAEVEDERHARITWTPSSRRQRPGATKRDPWRWARGGRPEVRPPAPTPSDPTPGPTWPGRPA